MNRLAIAAAVTLFALSAVPNASEAHGRRHHHHRHVAVAVAPVEDDCFLTRIFTRVTEGVGEIVRCRG